MADEIFYSNGPADNEKTTVTFDASGTFTLQPPTHIVLYDDKSLPWWNRALMFIPYFERKWHPLIAVIEPDDK